jgi:phosphoribosyl-ATP pyrophosphohydrolase
LAPHTGGFLFTQVEHEGGLAGFDAEILEGARVAAGDARVTAAGGITTLDDVCRLHRRGIDAQVGMAIYTGRFTVGQAVAAILDRPVGERYWPTVVCDQSGMTLGLVWSTRESLARAIDERRGIYWSRSRNELWVKGATSGAVQQLLRVHTDCDDDALRFTVRQQSPGFCHTGQRACWPLDFDLASLERVIDERRQRADPSSGTHRLFADEGLLRAKLREEADELADARTPRDVTHEAADLLYFAFVAMRRGRVALADVVAELGQRHRRVRRRPMQRKDDAGRDE